MLRFLAVLVLFAVCTTEAASRMGKSTYACSKKAATNAYDWEIKYLPITEATDDCEVPDSIICIFLIRMCRRTNDS